MMSQTEFKERYHVGGSRWSRLYNQHHEEIKAAKEGIDSKAKIDGSKWISDKFYTYNNVSDTYVTFLKTAPKPITMSGDQHRAMQRAYSNWDGNPSSINEICRTFSFPRAWFVEYKKVHGWTHDREPFTVEEVLDKEPDMLVEEALEFKRNVLFQKYEQEKWKETKDDADKWRRLLHGDIQPFNIAMSEWKPFEAVKLPKVQDDEKFYLIVGASDWQIGLKAIAENMTNGGSWNVEIGKKVLENYLNQIYRDIHRFRLNWGGCYMFNAGDLPHGFYGQTESGTELIMDVTRKQQYDAVFSLQTMFIEGLYKIFGGVDILSVAGNHEGAFGAYVVDHALQERYRNSEKIKITAHTKMVIHRKIGCVLFIISHGKNPNGFKWSLPARDNTNRQLLIQQEILYAQRQIALVDPESLKDIKQIIFISGDKHFFKQVEKGSYEDLQFGTPVWGDDYADSSRLSSRPSQTCLLVSDKCGVKSTLRYYLGERDLV